jgi:CheY-like chemotaxis protein
MKQSAHLVYVEDNPGDIALVKEVLHDVDIQLTILTNGEDALQYFRESSQNDSQEIQLIFLDINLPYHSGFELLSFIKSDPKLRTVPSIMFSTSNNPDDVQHGYGACANGYLIKSIDLKTYRMRVKQAVEYWTEINELPH